MWAGFLAPVHRTKVPGSSLPHCWGPPHTKRPTGCSCRRATAGALRRACAPQVHPAPNPASAGCLKSSNICCIHAKRLQLTVATFWNRSTVQAARKGSHENQNPSARFRSTSCCSTCRPRWRRPSARGLKASAELNAGIVSFRAAWEGSYGKPNP
jgi:hypothetical protein